MAWAFVAVALLVVAVAAWAAWFARRLDRLHVRVDSARAALTTQLARRADAAARLAARVAGAPGADDQGLVAAARAVTSAVAAAVRDGAPPDNVVENDIGRAARALVRRLGDAADCPVEPVEVDVLVADLEAATHRVALARAFYNGAVEDTRALRRARVVRWLRLAGHASLPAYFEIDDAPIAGAPWSVPLPRVDAARVLPTG